jgi:hypothetical protein
MRSKRIAPEAGRLDGASKFQNRQSNGAMLGTGCGITRFIRLIWTQKSIGRALWIRDYENTIPRHGK